MRSISCDISIDAPRDAVWRVLARLDAFAEFSPMVTKVAMRTEATAAVGAERRCKVLPAGHIDERVVEWIEGERLGLEVIGGMPLTGRGDWQLSGSNPTRVTFVFTYAPTLGWLGALMDRVVMARALGHGFRRNLAGLKAHVERGGNRAEATHG